MKFNRGGLEYRRGCFKPVIKQNSDLRFFNEQSLYSYGWYYDDFNYLKQTSDLELDDLEVKNEISFIFDSKFRCKEYYPNFLPWEFWQIIKYPVSACIIVECSEEELKLINKIIKRLPAGQIFKFKKISSTKKITLLAIVQLKNNIGRFFENFILALNYFSYQYYLTLIIPLSLYGEIFITK